MSYLEISDARVQAYAPVTARLIRNFRDNEHAVRTSLFAGVFPSPGFVEIEITYPGFPDTWTDVPGSGFKVQVLPGQHGASTHLSLRVELRLAQAALVAGANAWFRITDGTIHGPEVELAFAGGAGPIPFTRYRVDWKGSVATWGLKSWSWQVRGVKNAAAGFTAAGIRFDATTTGSILRGGSTTAAVAVIE